MSIGPDAMGHPLEFPQEFKQWLADYVALNVPKLPVGQVFGFDLQRVKTATVDTAQTRASTAYGDLGTVGPTLSNLADGWYMLVFGADTQTTGSTADQGYVSPSINGAAAVDADAAVSSNFYPSDCSIVRVLMVHLTNGGTNEVKLKYRNKSGTHTFTMRFLHAFKVLTLDE